MVVSCTAGGADVARGRTAIRFRLVRGSHVLATARTLLRDGQARAALRARRALAPGRYTLRIALVRADGVTGMHRSIRVR